jgi:GDPmannose 4,6-dehydratase
MKILITGAGQDSSYLAEYLLKQNHVVYVMTRRSCTSNHWRFAKCANNPNFTFVDGDITDPHTIISFLLSHKVDEIYNLAAQSHVGTSFSNPSATWASVAQGAMNIFEAVKTVSPDTCVYQASSSEMFGDMISLGDADGKNLYTNDYYVKFNILRHDLYNSMYGANYDIFQCIHTPFHPQSPYGVAKLAAHNTARIYREAYGLKIVCGILFNHESPRRGIKFVTRKITNHFWQLSKVEAVYKGNWPYKPEKLKLGNLDIYRDWGHAAEYVEYMVEMVRDGKFQDRVLATGQTISIREFAQKTIDLTFGPGQDLFDYIEVDDSLKRPSEVPYLKGISDWKPKIGVYDLIEDMLKNENGKI